MKCCKCGKEAFLRNDICKDCYNEILENKYRKRKSIPKNNYILNHIDENEKIIKKVESNKLSYFISVLILLMAVGLFPKTIFEFFINNQSSYFLFLVFNILLFFFGIYLVIDFTSRDIYLTNKRIIGKWGLFNVQKINIPLDSIQLVDNPSLGKLEIDSVEDNYLFDFVGNAKKFKHLAIEQKIN